MILNLTQHKATAEQIQDGIVDLPEDYRQTLISLLTFDTLPSPTVISNRARLLTEMACRYLSEHTGPLSDWKCMIGGAPYLMGPLEKELCKQGIVPAYAYTERVSVEKPDGNGGVVKTSVFKHVGLVYN